MSNRCKYRAWQDDEMIHSKSFGVYATKAFLDRCYEDCILMQWTGLTDKNGVDIYESDLVMINDKASGMKADAPAKVVFSHGYVGGWVLTVDGEHHLNMGTRTDCVEVIGNIYQDSRLLTDEFKHAV